MFYCIMCRVVGIQHAESDDERPLSAGGPVIKKKKTVKKVKKKNKKKERLDCSTMENFRKVSSRDCNYD